MPDTDLTPRLGPPTWTKARLERVLLVKYGHANRGGVNMAAAAADQGVSTRTLYRWLDTPDGRFRAKIPTPRLEKLIDSLLPSQETLDDEVYQLEHFRAGVAGWNARPQRLGPSWKNEGWLAQHQISILALNALPLRQVTITKARRGGGLVTYPRGEIVDSLIVPTKMHASVVAYELLRIHHHWRIHAPATPGIRTGRTWCWFNDAQPTDLTFTTFRYRPLGDPADLVQSAHAAP